MPALSPDDKTSPLENVVWLIAERIASVALSLVVTTVVARHLAPELFGRLNFLIALVALAAPVMASGLNSLVSREVLARPIFSYAIIGSALFIRAAIGMFVACIATVTSYYYFSVEDHWLFFIVIFASVLNAAVVIDFWLQAHLLNRYSAILRTAVLVLFSCLRILAVWLDAGVAAFVYILAAEYVLLGGFYLLIYHHLSDGTHRLRASVEECYGLMHHSRWLFFSGMAAVLYIKIDQVMLGVMVGDRALGLYVVVAKISEVWYFLPAVLVTSFFPQLINRRANDAQAYAQDLQKLNDLLFAMALALALGVSATAGWLVPWLFGADYAAAAPVLVVHIWAAILVFMRALLSKWLIVEDLLPLSLLSQVAGALMNVALNYYLIPLYGPLGAAYATVASYAVAGYLILFVHPDLRPMARIVSRSLALPYRLARHGRALYVR